MTALSSLDSDVLHGLCDVISDPAVVLNADGVFVDTVDNAHNTALLYQQPDSLIGSDLWEVFSEEQVDHFHEVIEATLETGELQRTEYQLSLEGQTRHFEGRVTAIGDDDTERVLWLAEDITERKQLPC